MSHLTHEKVIYKIERDYESFCRWCRSSFSFSTMPWLATSPATRPPLTPPWSSLPLRFFNIPEYNLSPLGTPFISLSNIFKYWNFTVTIQNMICRQRRMTDSHHPGSRSEGKKRNIFHSRFLFSNLPSNFFLLFFCLAFYTNHHNSFSIWNHYKRQRFVP